MANYRPTWQRQVTKPLASAVGGGSSPYKRGRDFEQAVRGRLQRRGYFVMRAHMSKGKIDLLAVKGLARPEKVDSYLWTEPWPSHLVLGIQCKRRGSISSTEWNDLIDLCEPYGIMPVVCVKVFETGQNSVAFYRLDEKRLPRKPGRPWTQIDPANGEPLPVQIPLV